MANTVTTTQGYKLTQNMITAILSAEYNTEDAKRDGHTGYVIHNNFDGRTRKALHNRGLMHGHYYLTQEGMNALAELSGNDIDTEFPTPESNVEIQGEYVEPITMTELDGTVVPYDAFGSMAIQEARARIADNGCVGLCETEKGCEHCDTQYGRNEPETDAESLTVDDLTPNGRSTYAYYANNGMDDAKALRKAADMCGILEKTTEDVTESLTEHVDNSEAVRELMNAMEADSMAEEFVPMDRTGDGITSVMTVMVIQNTPGMAGVTHYHAPECRDIQREMKRWGQRPSDAFENGFETVAELLEFECGDQASDHAEANTPEWWSEIFHNATPDGGIGGVKIMPCLDIPNGVTSDGSPIVRQGNFYRAGFKRAETGFRMGVECNACGIELESMVSDHTCPESEAAQSALIAMEDEHMGTEYDGSGRFPCVKLNGTVTHKGECSEAKGINGPCCSLEDDVTETPAKWVSYQHTLTVGDVVKSTENKGLFTVYALIPGLPVVYVDAHDGEMPFPVPASKVYAL